MIKELKQKGNKLEQWHKIYCYLPKYIEVEGIIYRIWRERLWRKGTIIRANMFGEWWYWEYSLIKPKG